MGVVLSELFSMSNQGDGMLEEQYKQWAFGQEPVMQVSMLSFLAAPASFSPRRILHQVCCIVDGSLVIITCVFATGGAEGGG